jgi:transcriptional regulator with XRE-family HTH domain
MAVAMDADVERYLSALRQLIERSGRSFREVERRLGWPIGRLSRLLSGATSLKVGSVLDLLRGLGVEPLVFYQLVHGKEPAGWLEERLADGPQTQPAVVLPPAMTEGELERRLEEAVRIALARLKTGSGA